MCVCVCVCVTVNVWQIAMNVWDSECDSHEELSCKCTLDANDKTFMGFRRVAQRTSKSIYMSTARGRRRVNNLEQSALNVP